MNLNGDPYNLQGGGAPIQGSSPSLQAGANPQQASGIYGPPAPTTAPVAPVRAVKPKAAATRPSIIQSAQPKPLNSIFEPYIGTRPSPYNPGVLEYFRKDTNQPLSQQDLFGFASQLGAGQINSFAQLHAPVNKVSTQVFEQAPVTDANQSLAETAGTANLSPDEVIKLLQQSNALTPEQLAQINDQLGIPEATKAAFEPPKQNTVDFYNEAYNGAGLADVKRQILALNEKVNSARDQFTDAQAQDNENPFLSESSRVGRVKRLQERAEQQIGNLLDQQKQYQDLYQQGLNEVNNLVTRHAGDFQTNQELNAARLTYLTSRAEQQAAAAVAEKNQAAYKYLPDYLKAKAKATAPGTVSAGNGATFYYDKASGTFVQLTQPSGQFELATNPLTGEQAPFNKTTGVLGGANSNFGGYGEGTARRLVANNNPTAFTTDVARTMGLVEGVDYVQGDKFPGSSSLYTAKLLGDPIAITIKGLDQAGFFTASGKPRWSYVNELPQDAVKNWKNLSYEQKAAVIQQMFIREGGKGTLAGGQPSSSTIENLVQQVIANPALLATLPEQYQKAVIARLAQGNLQVPSAKPVTDTQNQAAGYATRIEQATSILDGLELGIANYNPAGFKAQQLLPNFAKSEQKQSYEQAARNFINAVLRRESGAAIAQSEFDNAYKQYLPYPGDYPSQLQQKRQNRQTVYNSLIQTAGPANGLKMPSGFWASGNSTVNLSDLNFAF